MARWSIILVIACATYAALAIHDAGLHRKVLRAVADSKVMNWQPAAGRDSDDRRTEDAFQRAWNVSEERVDRLLQEPEP
jgi:hypothetical protein